MTVSDILLTLAIVAFLLAWWIRSVPSRGRVPLASATVARWQPCGVSTTIVGRTASDFSSV